MRVITVITAALSVLGFASQYIFASPVRDSYRGSSELSKREPNDLTDVGNISGGSTLGDVVGTASDDITGSGGDSSGRALALINRLRKRNLLNMTVCISLLFSLLFNTRHHFSANFQKLTSREWLIVKSISSIF
jgi:hypothetical protein